MVKSISCSCMFCKNMLQGHVKVSDFAERLEAGHKPFTYTSVNFFGPFLVKHSLAEVKHYACLFTCMNIRAEHLEKLNAMDTNSFINGFRWFAAHRGMPSKYGLTMGQTSLVDAVRLIDATSSSTKTC